MLIDKIKNLGKKIKSGFFLFVLGIGALFAIISIASMAFFGKDDEKTKAKKKEIKDGLDEIKKDNESVVDDYNDYSNKRMQFFAKRKKRKTNKK